MGGPGRLAQRRRHLPGRRHHGDVVPGRPAFLFLARRPLRMGRGVLLSNLAATARWALAAVHHQRLPVRRLADGKAQGRDALVASEQAFHCCAPRLEPSRSRAEQRRAGQVGRRSAEREAPDVEREGTVGLGVAQQVVAVSGGMLSHGGRESKCAATRGDAPTES